MTDHDQQSQGTLFESFEPSSTSEAPSSPLSREQRRSSKQTKSQATPSVTPDSSPHVQERLPLDSAVNAATSFDAVTFTEESLSPETLLARMLRRSILARLLATKRPATLAECSNKEQLRPCPWAGCRHHLLLEVAKAKNSRPTKIRMNTSNTPRQWGRRRGLAFSAAEAIVRAWIDDAVEMMWQMPYTCTFDVVRDYPDGLPPNLIGVVLGVSSQEIRDECASISSNERVRRALGNVRK